MMKVINISPVPSQSFTINIGNYRYDITLKLIEGNAIAYDFFIDQQPVIRGQVIMPAQLFMPYAYQEKDGNFFLFVPEGAEPSYPELGRSQLLYYLTAAESAEVRSLGN